MTAPDATSDAGHADEEYGMPCAEALLAGALALMTGHAQACCDGQRAHMAGKVADSLHLLSRHAGLSPDFRAMLRRLQRRWVPQEAGPAEPLLPPQTLWHQAPGAWQ